MISALLISTFKKVDILSSTQKCSNTKKLAIITHYRSNRKSYQVFSLIKDKLEH